MMRALRRQLRSWRQEFLLVWRRLRSFHRLSLGIILAFAGMSAANRYLFQPVKAGIAEEQEKQKELEVPELVTRPEDDPDIQELELRIEGFEKTLAQQRKALDDAVAKWPPFNKAEQGAIVAKFNDLIARAGLRCLKFGEGPLPAAEDPTAKSSRSTRPRRAAPKEKDAEEDKTPAAKTPLDTVVHHCVLAGSFGAIRKFFEEAEQFGYPAEMGKVRLELPQPASDEASPLPPVRPNAPPEIQLSFELKLYFHE